MSSTVAGKKRKSDASKSGPAAKKARLMVDAILADTDSYPVPEDDDDARQSLVELAKYARSLEEQLAASQPQPKTAAQLEAAAEKLRSAARSGIKKQMTWKPSCKTGSSKWMYDGVCSDADVFGAMLNLGGPPTFKAKKMTAEEFQDVMGSIEGSARYNTLYMKGNVNIQWKANEGTFKFSGTHGI